MTVGVPLEEKCVHDYDAEVLVLDLLDNGFMVSKSSSKEVTVHMAEHHSGGELLATLRRHGFAPMYPSVSKSEHYDIRIGCRPMQIVVGG